jgi:hypothetical protein
MTSASGFMFDQIERPNVSYKSEQMDSTIILFFLRVTKAKIEYFHKKYLFEVDDEVYLDDTAGFLQ